MADSRSAEAAIASCLARQCRQHAVRHGAAPLRTRRRLLPRRRPLRGGLDRGADRVRPGGAARPGPPRRHARPAPRRRRRGPRRAPLTRTPPRPSECARRHPHLAAEHEGFFLEHAADLGAEGFRVAGPSLARRRRRPLRRRTCRTGRGESHLHASRSFDGWLRLDGLFTPGDADIVEAALGAGVDRALRAAHDGDPSTGGQPVSALRAAALVDLAAQSMRHEPTDTSVPDRYRVAVVVRAGENPSPPRRRATPPPTGPSSAPPARSSTWAARPTAGRPPSAGRSPSTTAAAASPAVIGRPPGATSTTAPPGRRAAAPPSTTAPWSVGATTRSSTDNAGRSPSTAADPTRRPDGTPHTINRWHTNSRAS